MVIRAPEAEKVILETVDFGVPQFLVSGQVKQIAAWLYSQGYGLALLPLEAGYSQLSSQQAFGVVMAALKAQGLSLDVSRQVSDGLAKMAAKNYVFVKRTA
jgi:hypothetical protein